MVLFIDSEFGSSKLERSIVAATVSAMYLAILALARPYRRADDLYLACLSSLLLACCFISGIVVQLCEDVARCEQLVGFDSADGAIAFVIALTVAMLAVSLAVVAVAAANAATAPTIRFVSSGREPLRDGFTLGEGMQWHLFLSHVWSTGQDAVAVIKNQLRRLLPGIQVFLDVDNLQRIGDLEAYIGRSQVVLIFLSRGCLRSKNCLREVRAALRLGKPLILVHEADPTKGGGTLRELRAECPVDLQPDIFDAGWPLVVWQRIEDFQRVSLKMIAEALLLQTPKYRSQPALPLRIPGELQGQALSFPVQPVLWVSTANDGARALAEELRVVFPNIGVMDDAPNATQSDAGEATHMLLYLRDTTWSDELLSEHVKAARARGMPIVMAHENDPDRGGCSFDRFFQSTPDEPLSEGLYDALAVACLPGSHRGVSLLLIAKELGGTTAAGARVRSVTRASLVPARQTTTRSKEATALPLEHV